MKVWLSPAIYFSAALMAVALLGLLSTIVSGQPQSAATALAAKPKPATGAKLKAPTEFVPLNSCVTGECHPGIKQHAVLHGPLNVNSCDSCHQSIDESAHAFVLRRKTSELCTFCHQVDTHKDEFIHKPITTGDCTGCHDPHGGPDRRLLKPNEFGQACATCHKDHDFREKHAIHGPVAAGECYGCHAAHSGHNQKLLVQTGRELCMTCHRELETTLETFAVAHKPAQEDCLQCHNPHATDHRGILRDATAPLCTSTCHADVRHAVTDALHKHPPVTEDDGCTNCHQPHGSNRSALMKARPVDACLKCHDKPIEKPDKSIVAAVAQLTDEKLFAHGPVREGSCAGCHEVHGGDESSLLAAGLTQEFYEPFAVERYDLCFRCHERDMVRLPTSAGMTAFRDGEKNLHYVHVNRVKNGRTCRACHDTHVSTNSHLIRDHVPFGQWELPINFQATASGGSCMPGCHQELRYDRVTPFNDRVRASEASVKPVAPARDGSRGNAPAATTKETFP